jgi:hypothetical protein
MTTTATKRKQSNELLLLKNSGFVAMRSTYEDCGWLTDGRMMFMPSESFVKKMKALKYYQGMNPEGPTASKAIHALIKDATNGITEKLKRIESIYAQAMDEVMLSDHNYREYGCDRKDRLQWNGGYVDMIFGQYKDANIYLSDTRLVFKVGSVVVAIVQGVVYQ